MVTKDIIFAKIVVESKAEACYGAVELPFFVKERFFYFLPGNFCKVYFLSINNVWLIVKMPGRMKRI